MILYSSKENGAVSITSIWMKNGRIMAVRDGAQGFTDAEKAEIEESQRKYAVLREEVGRMGFRLVEASGFPVSMFPPQVRAKLDAGQQISREEFVPAPRFTDKGYLGYLLDPKTGKILSLEVPCGEDDAETAKREFESRVAAFKRWRCAAGNTPPTPSSPSA